MKNIKFKDQPNGKCLECKWNHATEEGAVSCHIPKTHLTNPICIDKLILIESMNIDYELREQNRDLGEGEEWRNHGDK